MHIFPTIVLVVGRTDQVKEAFFAISPERRLKHPAAAAISEAARTDDNGERLRVRGARAGDRFEVATRDGKEALAACVMTFAYWNPAMLEEARLLNQQTGEYNEVRVEPLGEEVVDVRGRSVPARRYALHARDLRIDVWYAADKQWVQLESRTSGGRLLRYLIQ